MYQSVDPPSDRPVILPSHCSSAQQRRRKDFKVPGVGAAPAAAFKGHDQTTGRKWRKNYNSEIECFSFTVLLIDSLSVNKMISNIDIFPILKHMCCIVLSPSKISSVQHQNYDDWRSDWNTDSFTPANWQAGFFILEMVFACSRLSLYTTLQDFRKWINVNPGLINPYAVELEGYHFSSHSSLFGEPPQFINRGLWIGGWHYLIGGFFPSEKYVSWDDYSQYMEK